MNEIKEEKLENLEIGEDKPQVEAKEVSVEDIQLIEVTNKAGRAVGNKLVLKVKHPTIKVPLEISGVTYLKNGKVTTSGLWVTTDSDNKIPYRSALATMLRTFGAKKVTELKGKSLPTTLDDGGFLTIKAY